MDHDDAVNGPYSLTGGGSQSGVLESLGPADGLLPHDGRAAPDRAVEMARALSGIVQDLVRRLDEQEAQREQLHERIRALEASAQALVGTQDQLRKLAAASVSREELEYLQRAVQSLAKDPNHIMVLATVAQQANNLLSVVGTYAHIQESLS